MSLSQCLVPAELPYPKGASSSNQGTALPVAPAARGFLERIFAPAELPYPVGSRTLPSGNTLPVLPQPQPSMPPSSNDAIRIVRVSIENPDVVASISSERLSEVSEFAEVASAVELDSGPIVISVPAGDFNKVELFFGSLVGEGAEELIALGEPTIREASVVSGGTVTVTVPWKFAPWLTVPARQLLVELIAVFSKTA